VVTRILLVRALLSENFFMSAQRGALCLRAAMSLIFFPNGFLDAISITLILEGYILKALELQIFA